jgi:hypothetical protein
MRVVAVPVHPYAEGLDAAQGQPGVERTADRAHGVLVEGQFAAEADVGDDQRAAQDVGMAAEVLGGRVHDHVGAERQGPLQVRRGERVVHDEQRPGVMGDLCERGDVGDAQERVGGRLHPDHPGVGPDGGAYGLDAGHRHRVVLQAPSGQDLGDEAVRAPVGVVGNDDVIARLADRPEQRVFGRHSGCEREPAHAALKRREALFQRGTGGVGGTAVLIAAAQPPDAVLLVGGDLIYRRDDRPRGGVGILASVNGKCVEAGHVVETVHEREASTSTDTAVPTVSHPQG